MVIDRSRQSSTRPRYYLTSSARQWLTRVSLASSEISTVDTSL